MHESLHIDFDRLAENWLYEWRKYLVDVGLVGSTALAVTIASRKLGLYASKTMKSHIDKVSKSFSSAWKRVLGNGGRLSKILRGVPALFAAGAVGAGATVAQTVAWGAGLLLSGLFIIDAIFEAADMMVDISAFGKLNFVGFQHKIEEVNDLALAIKKGGAGSDAKITISGEALALLALATSEYCTEPVSATASEVFPKLYSTYIQTDAESSSPTQVVIPIKVDDPDDLVRFPKLLADMQSYYERWFIPHDFVVQMFALLLTKTKLPVSAKAVLKVFGLMEGE